MHNVIPSADPGTDPILSKLYSSIQSGHSAAAFIATETKGEFRYEFPLDADVIVEATYSGEPTVALTLIEVLDRAARGRVPVSLGGRPGALVTVANGRILVTSGEFVARIEDLRAAVAAPLSDWVPPMEQAAEGTTGTFGERLTRWVQATTIEGAKARLEAAKRQSDANERQVVASTAAEVFLPDIGLHLLDWWIFEANRQGKGHFLACSPSLALPDEPREEVDRSRGRAALYEAVVRAFEKDAGTERHQHRGERVTFEALGEELENPFPDAGALERVELADLVARAKLTDRQREVLALYYDAGRTDAEIANQFEIAVSTVTNTRSRALEKLRAIT